jgi:hypothetical protein
MPSATCSSQRGCYERRLQQIITGSKRRIPVSEVFATKKTGHFEQKTTLLAATRRRFRNLLSISFVARAE